MASSSQKNEQALYNRLYDPVRKKWVDRTPEEIIRQSLLCHMIEKLGYPPALISIEKELAKLPHLASMSPRQIPKRRADIIVFAKTKHSTLTPLLMIECKAIALTPNLAEQVIGYNTFVQAPFVALANERQVLIGSYDQKAGMYRFEQGLPPFHRLMQVDSSYSAIAIAR